MIKDDIMNSKWENARFLINAKKCIDSMLYISINTNKLSNINLLEKCDTLRQKFYINAANLLDVCFNTREKKKHITQNDPIIKRVYYERDKREAHKDKNYKPINYNSLNEEIEDKKKQLNQIKNLCNKFLPNCITIDYVPHDSELFRLINRINATLENDLNLIKYPLCTFHSYQLSDEGRHAFKDFDTENYDRTIAKLFGYDYDEMIKQIKLQNSDNTRVTTDEEKMRQQYILANGINSYEGLQLRQDFCIGVNIHCGLDMWVTKNEKGFQKINKLKEQGILDDFEIYHFKETNKN